MSNANRYSNQPKTRNEQKQAHPIWRGVGFGLMVLLPIISYATALILIGMNNTERWIMIPRDLLVRNQDPLLLIKFITHIDPHGRFRDRAYIDLPNTLLHIWTLPVWPHGCSPSGRTIQKV